MEAHEINGIGDAQRFVEGCINDFEAGIATKEETVEQLKKYTFRIIDITLEETEQNILK